jgi:hypothetical protein
MGCFLQSMPLPMASTTFSSLTKRASRSLRGIKALIFNSVSTSVMKGAESKTQETPEYLLVDFKMIIRHNNFGFSLCSTPLCAAHAWGVFIGRVKVRFQLY